MHQRLFQCLLFFFYALGLVAWSSDAFASRQVYISLQGQDIVGCGQTQANGACRSLIYTLLHIATSGDVILLEPGTYEETSSDTIIFGNATSLVDLTIKASDKSEPVTIDRKYSGRLFDFGSEANNIVFENLRFYRGGWKKSNAAMDYAGGLMRFNGPNHGIRFEKCIFESNRNPNNGYIGRAGVGLIRFGNPTFKDCLFQDNWGGVAGTFHVGGAASPIVENCVFENSGCYEGGWGGVVVPEEQSSGTWKSCTFRNNTCDFGGAVDDGGTASTQFIDCTFENNFGRALGGAYYGFGSSRLSFSKCSFVGNRVAKGANSADFYLSSSSNITFEECLFDAGDDSVMIPDGACGNARDSSVLTMKKCTIQGYKAAQGAIAVTLDAIGLLEDTLFQNNHGVSGGAVFASGQLTIRRCNFRDNIASDGAAIIFKGSEGVEMVIEETSFKNNLAKSMGGAIKHSGTNAKLTIHNTTFDNNLAQEIGGGAIYLNEDNHLKMDNCILRSNAGPSGGSIWSFGNLQVSNSKFLDNYLLMEKDQDDADVCGNIAGSGGAIFSRLRVTSTSVLETITNQVSTLSTSSCLSGQLQLTNCTFERNKAPSGGGGAVFLDKKIPTCLQKMTQVCTNCTFSQNEASFGPNIGSIATQLTLLSTLDLSEKWTWQLMEPQNLSIGAMDVFNQRLQGGHTPLSVRMKLASQATLTLPSTKFKLSTNSSRTLRNGELNFRELIISLQQGIEQRNVQDSALALVFYSTSASSGSSSSSYDAFVQELIVPLTLAKCPLETNGVVTTGGRCMKPQATDDTKDKMIAGLIVSIVSLFVFLFTLYWSYRHSQLVVQGLKTLMLGVGGSILKFSFEIADIASDVQTLVSIFMYDLSLNNMNPTVVRVAYVSCFGLSLIPSILLIRYSFQHIFHQLTLSTRLYHHHQHESADKTAAKNKKVSTTSSIKSRGGLFDWCFGRKKKSHKVAAIMVSCQEEATVDIQKCPPKTLLEEEEDPHHQLCQVDKMDRQLVKFQHEKEFHEKKARLMKTLLVRMITEDLLLLILNLYIYLSHRGNVEFMQSSFSRALEFSILTSAVMFGGQLQHVALWMNSNPIQQAEEQMRMIHTIKSQSSRLLIIKQQSFHRTPTNNTNQLINTSTGEQQQGGGGGEGGEGGEGGGGGGGGGGSSSHNSTHDSSMGH